METAEYTEILTHIKGQEKVHRNTRSVDVDILPQETHASSTQYKQINLFVTNG